MKHTKGPWTTFEFNGRYSIEQASKELNQDILDANAKLIAAAPEMLEVLELYEGIDDLESQARFTEAVIKVIKKARGE